MRGSVFQVRIMNSKSGFKARRAAAKERIANLNERERSLVRMLIQGMTHKMIAARMDLSVRTIEQCKRNTLAKTGTKSSAQLAAVAVLSGDKYFWDLAMDDPVEP